MRERNAEMELEKLRMEFELTRLRFLHEENERQRQHAEVMEQLRQQAAPRLVGDGPAGPRVRDARAEGARRDLHRKPPLSVWRLRPTLPPLAALALPC